MDSELPLDEWFSSTHGHATLVDDVENGLEFTARSNDTRLVWFDAYFSFTAGTCMSKIIRSFEKLSEIFELNVRE